jgi:RNA polymerase sigma-70 factor (ECF subfamily)
VSELAAVPDEAALIERIRRGERAAERELFRRERGRVHATLYRVLGTNRDMEDLVQEAFLEVFRSLPGFRGEARLATWVDRITVRVAYRWLSRKRPPAMPLEALPEADSGPSMGPDQRVAAREGVRRVYAALALLSPAARIAFALHVIEGRPIVEVARLVGSAVVATKVRIWRARRELERQAAADPVLADYLIRSTEGEDE